MYAPKPLGLTARLRSHTARSIFCRGLSPPPGGILGEEVPIQPQWWWEGGRAVSRGHGHRLLNTKCLGHRVHGSTHACAVPGSWSGDLLVPIPHGGRAAGRGPKCTDAQQGQP